MDGDSTAEYEVKKNMSLSELQELIKPRPAADTTQSEQISDAGTHVFMSYELMAALMYDLSHILRIIVSHFPYHHISYFVSSYPVFHDS